MENNTHRTPASIRVLLLPFALLRAVFEAVARALRTATQKDLGGVAALPANLASNIFLHAVGLFKWEIYRFQTRNSQPYQEKVLKNILRKNASTEYGRKNRFAHIGSVQEFQKSVPVITYANIQPAIERMAEGEHGILCHEKPVIYATTSGTTAKPKYLPVTPATVKRGHKLTQLIWMHRLFQDSPSFISGKILAIVSPAIEGYLPSGTPYGSATGFISKKVPRIIRGKYALPAYTSEISDYTAKYYFILRRAVEQNDITYFTAANPSTILLLCQKMQEWSAALIEDIHNGTLREDMAIESEIREKSKHLFKPNPKRAHELHEILATQGELTPQHVWPKLKTLGCWTGGNSGSFLNSLEKFFSRDVAIRDLGYLASELKGSMPLHHNNAAGALAMADTFFEFAEVEEWNNATHWKNVRFLLAHELEVGKPYYIFVTNNSGLYRYDINDIVQVKSFHDSTPEIVFLQKGKGATNITGEKLYESQVVAAVEKVKQELGLDLYFYLCVANAHERRYNLLAEFENKKDSSVLETFASRVDSAIQEINMEYATKRSSLRLKNLSLQQIPPGGFANFKARKVREGQREGQFKLVILSADTSLINNFELEKNCG